MPPARFLTLCAVLTLAASSASTVGRASLAKAGPPTRALEAHPRLANGCSREMRRGHGLQRFVASLRPGDVGCLPPGDYRAKKLTFTRSGRPLAPITLRSLDPAQPAAIHGVVWVHDGANYVVVQDLAIVGDSGVLPTVIVNGNHSIWNRLDVSDPAVDGQSGGICFSLGQLHTWGYAGNTTIENSRIHDCGATTNTNHGIYVQATTGRTIIRDNWIFRNGDRGVQLYPAARDVLVSHNLFYENGSGVLFSGDENHAAQGVTVTDNVISDSTARWNVESFYTSGSPIGTGNLVVHNCLWATNSEAYYRSHGGIAGAWGFSVAQNVIRRPVFVGAADDDLRLTDQSGCKGYGVRTSWPPGPRAAQS